MIYSYRIITYHLGKKEFLFWEILFYCLLVLIRRMLRMSRELVINVNSGNNLFLFQRQRLFITKWYHVLGKFRVKLNYTKLLIVNKPFHLITQFHAIIAKSNIKKAKFPGKRKAIMFFRNFKALEQLQKRIAFHKFYLITYPTRN